jgi:hypothetical protein
MEQEIWKDVIWFEGLYQVSNLGNVKSLKYWKEKILKYWIDTRGYCYVNLYKKGTIKTFSIHRLIGLYFINNSKNKPEINHKNGIKSDNRVENLEWCTHSENIKHNYSALWFKSVYQINHPTLWKFWKLHHWAKKVNQYTKQWEFIKTWDSIIDANRFYNISDVSAVCRWNRKTAGGYKWKYFIN